jgi:outer membrane lipoprotein carrier protein
MRLRAIHFDSLINHVKPLTTIFFMIVVSIVMPINTILANKSIPNDKDQLLNKLSKIQHMHADFVQRTNLSQGKTKLSKGQIWVSKPKYFKWQIQKPYRELLVSDGKKLWDYDQALKQVTVREVPQRIAQAPYLLLLSGKLSKLPVIFNIKQIKPGFFHLVTKKKDGTLLKKVKLKFDQNNLVFIQFETVTDRTSQITFKHISNQKIPRKIYRFSPPEGVDVYGKNYH